MSDFCQFSGRCNSCQLLNLSYEEQLKYKEKKCRTLLSPLCRVMPITPSPTVSGYRNKAQFVFKKEGRGLISGIYKSGSHTMAALKRCALCSDRANALAEILCRLFHSFKVAPYDYYTGRGWLRSVVIREAFGTGEMMLTINGTDAVFPAKRTFATALQKACPDLTTAVIAVNRDSGKLFTGRVSEVLFGEGQITDTLCGERFILSPASFYQVNHDQTEQLYNKAIGLMNLGGRDTILDAYCGIGTIGIIAARQAGRVIGVELNPAAIRDAKRSATLNGIGNIAFTAADSKLFAKELADRGERIDGAFIDPPRAGCTASFLKALARLNPERIVYISCNPETQARDIRVLSRLGYRAETAHPFDMFPHTNHIETVTLITRAE
jgi:23S rRNA (uracil1939-C5)-methyltransferase